ncbi:alpha/beta fold hydrolase [Cohnella lubricantis]|uniref:Alpha/beta fold hydrolase n=1 Tax=Cohnella lubricantis TaxID=2163172 RepID=A0A841TB69_9BACL|nr:alpha/beta fold hydrolase [Cohnella lubricantis]MBB6678544.1 alpha/beta fold hydrolase [Cohnella lubricantis]MBP2119147.1 pimeloyl-ACP methyl ester carboxylesterase/Mg-chelatase subunit ChlD [Cohnella lubricantis]
MRLVTSWLPLLLLLSLIGTAIPYSQNAHADILPYEPVVPLPILFVHGYDDKGSSWEEADFYNYVQTLGAEVVSVDYNKYSRNDITSTKINNLFTEAVDQLPSDTKFDIVAHSMGGLLTRYYLLQNEDVRSRVRRVIMIGTPNHGSPIAWQNRVSDMIDDPKDYWEDGMKNAEIVEYRDYYNEYTDNMFDTYGGGQIEEQSYELWLSEHHPEVIDAILEKQQLGAGGELTDLGAEVLPGGLDYRYSEAFNIYAKILAARSFEREERQAKMGMIVQGVPFSLKESFVVEDDNISNKQQLTGKDLVDEGTALKEGMKKGCTYNPFTDCDQPATAKNIVQDRLMLERFELHYYENDQIQTEYVVSNLFLSWLAQEESRYRAQALRNNTYYPQYITIATVDDPDNKMGRWTTDLFVKNMSAWKYEDHDSVVPLKSVTLFSNGEDQFLDRNVKIIPGGSSKISKDPYAIQREGGYTFHGDQMAATDLLRNEYNNPLTGTNDSEVTMDIVPGNEWSADSSIIIAKPANESLGNDYKLEISSNHKTTVRIMERDQDQMWTKMKTVPLLKGDYSGYRAEVDIAVNEDVTDYLIVGASADDKLTAAVHSEEDPEQDELGYAPVGRYPYYLQPLDTTVEGDTVRQRFRVYNRANDQAVSGLDASDFIFKLNGKTLLYPRLSMEGVNIERAGNIMLALDYSSSMGTVPRNYSMMSAYNFLSGMNMEKSKAQVGVIGFTDQVRLLAGLTTDYAKAAKAVYIEDTGGTSLYDAIVDASSILAREKGKKSLLLLTDGEDSGGSRDIEEAIESAKSRNITVYLLGFGDANVDVLQRIADETGGKFYFANEAVDLSGLYSTVTTEKDYIYTLEYEAPDLTKANEMTMKMTQDRSNEAAVPYDSLQLPLPDIQSWWDKAKDLINDMKEGG